MTDPKKFPPGEDPASDDEHGGALAKTLQDIEVELDSSRGSPPSMSQDPEEST